MAQLTQNGDKAVSYEYDSLNRLERENNKLLNKTVIFTYDTNGNIANRCEYPYTVKSGEELSELTCKHFDYIYNGDRLVKILSDSGEETFAYNNLGSPTIYRNKQLQWQYGKLLTKYGDTTFEYDGLGRRIRKGEIEYIYDSAGKLVGSSDGTTYIYDDKGVAGFVNADGMCLYRKDAQGNIIAILDSAGAVMVRYEYDAWGNHIVLDGNGQEITDPEHIGNVNPYRYRGYFYDEETGLYYLQTRYYDPSIGRFISQDSIEYAAPQSINGLNLYAYCNNNPVMNIDPTGCKEISTSNIIDFVSFMFQFAIGLGLGIVGWAVKTGIRPNNIGIGTYAKYQSQQLANLTKFSNVVSKISTAVAIITVLVTVGEGIYNDVNRGYPTDRIVSNAITNTVIYGGITLGLGAIGSAIGTAVGTIIPGLGNAIGAAVGFAIGAVIGFVLEIEINGKSIIDHIRDGVYSFWKWLFGKKAK